MATRKMENSFGAQIRKWRREQELTLVDVADAVGISIVYLSDIERGKRNPPSDDLIEKIAGRLEKMDRLGELVTLANSGRRSIEISLPRKEPELADVLHALARRVGEGTVDSRMVAQLKELLHGG